MVRIKIAKRPVILETIKSVFFRRAATSFHWSGTPDERVDEKVPPRVTKKRRKEKKDESSKRRSYSGPYDWRKNGALKLTNREMSQQPNDRACRRDQRVFLLVRGGGGASPACTRISFREETNVQLIIYRKAAGASRKKLHCGLGKPSEVITGVTEQRLRNNLPEWARSNRSSSATCSTSTFGSPFRTFPLNGRPIRSRIAKYRNDECQSRDVDFPYAKERVSFANIYEPYRQKFLRLL